LPKGTVVRQLVDLLEFPEKIRKTPITMLMSEKFCNGNDKLKDRDEVTLLWPVGEGLVIPS